MTVKELVELRKLAAIAPVEVYCGDVVEVLRAIPGDSFDACLTDPPYELGFMGKHWDSSGVAFRVETWEEVYRVLKPGAMLLAFGGTRTHHRLMCAIEDAGFEIRDCLMWLYGSGFPKSLDIGKVLDKAAGIQREVVGKYKYPDGSGVRRVAPCGSQTTIGRISGSFDITAPATTAAKTWDGWGTALKPAWEPIVLAMKPCDGTFAENALKWGVAGLNVDGGRINPGEEIISGGGHNYDKWRAAEGRLDRPPGHKIPSPPHSTGRWPANLLLDEEAAAMLDEQSGSLGKSAGGGRNVGGLSNTHHKRATQDRGQTIGFGDTGGASRFYYVAKASSSERGGSTHPTMKPLKLCQYLAHLLLPPARSTPRRILVPFSGSGSEMIGALRAGWDRATGIDNNPEYCEMAKTRIKAAATSGTAPVHTNPPL